MCTVTGYDDIWKLEDKIDLITTVHDVLICEKCSCGEGLEKLSLAEKAIYVCMQLEISVNNGGFPALVYNYSNILICDVVDSLIEIGAHRTAEIYKRLLAVCEIPKELSERNDWIADLPDDISEIMNGCDDDFYKQPDNLTELYYQYILKNKEQFACSE